MATSGRVSGSVHDGHYQAWVDWEVTEQNIGENTSTVKATLYFSCDWEIDIGSRTHKIWIDGEEFTIEDTPTSGTGTWPLGYVTKTIQHNADGTKAFSISFAYDMRAWINDDYYENITGSDSWTLNTIPRASQPVLSASTVELGDTITISMNRASDDFKHNLSYKFLDSEGTIANNVGTSSQWTVPMELANQLPDKTSGVGTVICNTYNSKGELIGTKEATFTANIPDSVVPIISEIQCTDPNGYLEIYDGFVQTKSKVKVDVDASGIYGSTISSYKIEANGQNYSVNGCVTDVLVKSGANVITVTVTDSRGRTATSSKTIYPLLYTSPTINSFSARRCNASGQADEEGAYIDVNCQASITPLMNLNGKTFTLKYKKQSESTWTTSSTFTKGYNWGCLDMFEASVNDAYTIMVTAQDDFSTTTAQINISTAYTLLDFNNSGKGIAFGKVSEQDKFEVNMETIFYKGVVTASGANLDEINTKLNEVLEHLGMD